MNCPFCPGNALEQRDASTYHCPGCGAEWQYAVFEIPLGASSPMVGGGRMSMFEFATRVMCGCRNCVQELIDADLLDPGLLECETVPMTDGDGPRAVEAAEAILHGRT